MAWHVEYNMELRLVECKVYGTITVDEINEAVEKVITLAGEKATHLILVDDKKLENTVETLEIYEMPKFYAELNIDRKMKVALILPDAPQLKEDLKFYETVCRNRGWNIASFEERKDAILWLTNLT